MHCALIVEDELADIRTAQRCARAVGFDIVEAKTTSDAARAYLEKALRGEGPRPDVIVLDLNLGYESGHETLRFWHTTPALKPIPMIVWSLYGDDHKLICECFQVEAYVKKSDGEFALQAALRSSLSRGTAS